MKQLVALAFAVLVIVLLLGTSMLRAQPPSDLTNVSDLERPIYVCQQQVASWRREQAIQIVSIVGVIAFGVIVSALYGSTAKWAKKATLALGVGTAILTGINSRVFTADDRTLRRAAFDGDGVIAQLWVKLGAAKDQNLSPQDRKIAIEEYLKKLAEFHAVGEKLNGITSANGAPMTEPSFALVPRVYAQSATPLPPWTQKSPSETVNLYFVGRGYDRSLANAKQNSFDNALHNAMAALLPHAPGASGVALLDLIKASAVTQDSAFAYDRKSGNYDYYTLLRVSKEIESVVKALPGRTVFQKPGWQPGDITFHPSSGLFALDIAGGVSRLAADQGGMSRIEELFRLRRSENAYAITANADSVFVASTSSIGCLVYKYTLASKAMSRRVVAPRERCVGIATSGSAVYVTIPSRHEIRFLESWEARSTRTWSFSNDVSLGFMVFDELGHRLIVADDSGGAAYAVSVPDGRKQRLSSNLGAVQSIAPSRLHIAVASGHKVLFLARADNRGENPPASLQSLSGGHIVGVAVDSADNLWFADYDNKLVTGPFPLI